MNKTYELTEKAKAHRLAPFSGEVAGYETPGSLHRVLPGQLELVSSRSKHHQEFLPRAFDHILTTTPLRVAVDIGQFKTLYQPGARLPGGSGVNAL
jgi:hypothetical protein